MMTTSRNWLQRLVRAGERLRGTPIVDDDFPQMRDEFDMLLKAAHRFLQENDRERTDWVAGIGALCDMYGSSPTAIMGMHLETRAAFYRFRVRHIQEELNELQNATTPEDAVDAIIDLCFMAIGTLYSFGVDAHKAFNVVLDANMKKRPGINDRRPNEFGLPDLVKPEGWQPPSHTGNIGILDKVFEEMNKPIPEEYDFRAYE